MKPKKINLIFFLLFSFLILFNFVLFREHIFAQKELEVEYPEIQGLKPETVTVSLLEYVKYIFNFTIAIIGLIGFGALIIGGIRYLTSAGNSEKIKNAKKQIKYAFLGILILLFSYLILTTINPQLVIFRQPVAEPVSPAELPGPLISEGSALDLLTRIGELAEAVKNTSDSIDNTAQEIKSLTDNCDCGTTQPMCLCEEGSYTVTVTSPEWSEWYNNTLALEESGITLEDTLLPCEVDPSLVESVGCGCEPLLSGSATVVNKEGFFDDELETLESAAYYAKEVFGPDYQDKVNSTDVFIFDKQGYENVNKAMVDNWVEEGEISWAEKDEYVKALNNFYGYNTENNVTIINGEDVLTYGATRAFIHEYAHSVDRTGPGSYQFSDSLEYKDIFDRSQLTGSGAFVSDYAVTNPREDFAETVKYYYLTDGDASQITTNPTDQALIQERFDYLRTNGIVQ